MRRREFVTTLAAASTATSIAAGQTPPAIQRKGRLKQCAMRANFDPRMPFDDMCREAARAEAKGFDLVGGKDVETLKKYGLIPTMMPGPASIKDGLVHKELHAKLEASFATAIDAAAAAGCPNVITVGGQRMGMPCAEGADNAVAFLNRIKARVEIDDTQEINYRFVAQAIAEPGFTGYIAHEYRPAAGRDPIKSLEQAIGIMDV